MAQKAESIRIYPDDEKKSDEDEEQDESYMINEIKNKMGDTLIDESTKADIDKSCTTKDMSNSNDEKFSNLKVNTIFGQQGSHSLSSDVKNENVNENDNDKEILKGQMVNENDFRNKETIQNEAEAN